MKINAHVIVSVHRILDKDQITIKRHQILNVLFTTVVFYRVYRLEIQLVVLVYSTPLVNSTPLTFSLVHLPPPPLPCVNMYSMYLAKGIGLCEEHMQDLYTVYLTRF
jgi:hypothetical protein